MDSREAPDLRAAGQEVDSIARFTRTLGTLISPGVPILEAINITKDTSGNFVFEKALGKVHDSIREGETFADPLRESKTATRSS
jgi:type IV pilus assembly protein PilC